MHLKGNSMIAKNPPVNPNELVEVDQSPAERSGPRVVYDRVTGYPVVKGRPGEPMVTSEEVKRLLEDFP
jgi:hypothetical protein